MHSRRPLLVVALSVLASSWVGALASDEPSPPVSTVIGLTEAKTADGKYYISWKEHRIDDSALAMVGMGGADGLAVADLDKDGHLDVVAVHEDCANHVRVSFGTDDPDKWESFTLSETSKQNKNSDTAVGGAEDVVIGDVNGDGRLDVVACGEGGALVYFQAPEHPRNKDDWKGVPIAKAGAEKSGWIRVDVGDLDGDGKLEVLAAHKRGGTDFACFRREGEASDPANWKHLVIGNAQMPINVRAVDIDGDGDVDVFGGSRGESKLVLFENLGNDRKWEEKWKEHSVVSGKIKFPTPASLDIGGTKVKVSSDWGCSGFMMDFADLDSDGRMEVLVDTKHGSPVFWMKVPKAFGAEWERFYIGHIAPDQATGVKWADINGDGRLDVITGGYSYTQRRSDPKSIAKPGAPCGRLAWFEQGADPKEPWKRHDISRRAQGMYDMFFACDLNGDGATDFIATRGNSSPHDGTIWLEQVRTEAPIPVFTSAWLPEEDSRQQPIPRDQ